MILSSYCTRACLQGACPFWYPCFKYLFYWWRYLFLELLKTIQRNLAHSGYFRVDLLVSSSISSLSNHCGQSLFFFFNPISWILWGYLNHFIVPISELHCGTHFFVGQIMSTTQYVLCLALFRQKFSKSQFWRKGIKWFQAVFLFCYVFCVCW